MTKIQTATAFYSRAEVLALLGISYPTLWDWCRRKHFPAARVLGPGAGKRTTTAWLKSEVDAWLASRPTTPTSPARKRRT